MSVAHRRELARQIISERLCSQRQVCDYFNLHRSSFRYQMIYPNQKQERVEEAIVQESLTHPELGSDKIGRLVRKQGIRVSNQRIRTVRRTEGLVVPPPRKKKCRRGASTGNPPQRASYRGHVWTWDFIHDRTIRGGNCRILSIVDEFTRECHQLHVDRSIGSKKVKEQLMGVIEAQGAPAYIRSDNGPEFIGKELCKWLEHLKIKTLYIEPGCPWQNGYVESFHDKFRRECLARELFITLSECRVVVSDWRRKYNEVRPHRSLGMKTPAEFARQTISPVERTSPDKAHAPFRPSAPTPGGPCRTDQQPLTSQESPHSTWAKN